MTRWVKAAALVATALSFTACGSASESTEGQPKESGALLHEITLGGRGAEEHVVPTHIAVRAGTRVRFLTVDHRVHTVRFLLDEMAEGPRAFLLQTDQIASPPLLSRGTRYVVSFEDAPAGFYPFEVRAHGEPVSGAIVIE